MNLHIGQVLMANMWLCVAVLAVGAAAAAFLRMGSLAALLAAVAATFLMMRSEAQQPALVSADKEA